MYCNKVFCLHQRPDGCNGTVNCKTTYKIKASRSSASSFTCSFFIFFLYLPLFAIWPQPFPAMFHWCWWAGNKGEEGHTPNVCHQNIHSEKTTYYLFNLINLNLRGRTTSLKYACSLPERFSKVFSLIFALHHNDKPPQCDESSAGVSADKKRKKRQLESFHGLLQNETALFIQLTVSSSLTFSADLRPVV